MSKKDWYLNADWDKEAEDFFESKLKRVRDSYDKAQYLRIKGNCLLKTNDKRKWEVGVKLLERVLDNYMEEETESYFACEILGDHYRLNNEIDTSEKYYRQVLSYYNTSRNGTSGIADIKLAEMIVDYEQEDKYEEMYLLLTEVFESTKGKLLFNDDRYRYAFVLSRLTDLLGINNESAYYATKALELSEISKPQLDDSKLVGVINSKKEEIAFLENIIARDN